MRAAGAAAERQAEERLERAERLTATQRERYEAEAAAMTRQAEGSRLAMEAELSRLRTELGALERAGFDAAQYEQYADAVAPQVRSVRGRSVQRRCAAGVKCKGPQCPA